MSKLANLFTLEGKTAFVTGAGSGIGQRIAVGFAEAGASVGCFDLSRSSSGLNETLKKIEEAVLVMMGGGVIYLKNNEAEIQNAFEYCRDAGMVTILFIPEP